MADFSSQSFHEMFHTVMPLPGFCFDGVPVKVCRPKPVELFGDAGECVKPVVRVRYGAKCVVYDNV